MEKRVHEEEKRLEMRENLSISILGDVCPDREFNRFFREIDKVQLGDIGEYLKGRDITVANLEAPASNRGSKQKKTGPCLHCPSTDVAALKRQGVQILSLANNHILDYGEEALLDTIHVAEHCDVKVFGAGMNKDEALKELIVEKNGWRIGFLSFAEHEFNVAYKDRAGANLFDPYESYDAIQRVKEDCDYLIILYHGGIEHYKLPSPLLQKKCRKMICSGADIVLCQHSHCIGTIEDYQGGTILYGQGNAFFGAREGNEQWNTGLMVDFDFCDKDVAISYKLIKAGAKGIHFANCEDSDARIKQMKKESERLNEPEYLKTQWIKYCSKEEAMVIPHVYGWNRYFNKLNRVFHNRLARRLIGKQSRMITMNLIRCESHREVMQTILEETSGIKY